MNEDTTDLKVPDSLSVEQQQFASEAKAISSRFLQAYEALFSQEEWCEARVTEFLKSYQEFKGLVLKCSRTIIAELSRDESSQTFPPNPNSEGIAGGEKRFCFNCIRVKIPQKPTKVDVYHSSEKAAKACKHELSGVDLIHSALFKSHVSGYRFIVPPCLVVDYLGYRHFIYPDLPLHHCTLKVGKSGETPGFPCYEASIAHSLNTLLAEKGLAPHGLRDGEKETPEDKYCALPCDAEVYQLNCGASSDVCYVIDLARVIPPRDVSIRDQKYSGTPSPEAEPGCEDGIIGSEYLSRHFRKEYVERYNETVGTGLSSDGFFPMSLKEDNQQIQEAEAYYQHTVPNEVAERLETLECASLSEFLVVIAHFHGLNLRELGDVYNLLCPCSPWRQRIIVEVAARSFRRIINSEWSWLVEAGALSDQAIASVVIKWLNMCLGHLNKDHDTVWNLMNEWKDKCFPALGEMTLSREDIMKPEIASFGTFMSVVSELLGITWNEEPWLQKSCSELFFSNPKPFECSMIHSVKPRVTEMMLVHEIRGFMFSSFGHEKEVIKELRSALARDPRNVFLLNSLAEVYGRLAVSLEEGQFILTSRDFSVKQSFLSCLAFEVTNGVPV